MHRLSSLRGGRVEYAKESHLHTYTHVVTFTRAYTQRAGTTTCTQQRQSGKQEEHMHIDVHELHAYASPTPHTSDMKCAGQTRRTRKEGKGGKGGVSSLSPPFSSPSSTPPGSSPHRHHQVLFIAVQWCDRGVTQQHSCTLYRHNVNGRMGKG
mmetsp:Transcript_21216/g.55182  ORF Transcript_21216/g.55182 Transcript_21216/m.55182 type:complete len:153 (-) Transcript_21216:1503-1961(-)